MDKNKLYKIKKDGLGMQKLNDSYSSYVAVVGDTVYYQNETKGNCLYKIGINGKNETKLNSDTSIYINNYGDYIYYTNDSDNGTLYKIKKDGKMRQQLDSSPSHYLNLSENYIYSSNNKKNSCFKISTNNFSKVTINPNELSNISNINVINDFVFFDGSKNGETFNYVMKSNGSKIVKLE